MLQSYVMNACRNDFRALMAESYVYCNVVMNLDEFNITIGGQKEKGGSIPLQNTKIRILFNGLNL